MSVRAVSQTKLVRQEKFDAHYKVKWCGMLSASPGKMAFSTRQNRIFFIGLKKPMQMFKCVQILIIPLKGINVENSAGISVSPPPPPTHTHTVQLVKHLT